MNGIWVFCEQSRGKILDVAYELTGEAARLGKSLSMPVTAVAFGTGLEQHAPALCESGADEVLLVDDAALDAPEELRYAFELCALAQKYRPSIVLTGATAFGRSMAPRVAARLKTGLTADCTQLEIDPDTGLLLQTRPAFGGNLLATITCPQTLPQMATVRPRVFPLPAPSPGRPLKITREVSCKTASPIQIVEWMDGGEGINIADFDVLVSVGQGIGGARNISLAEELAARLGGTLSASRALVDAGLLPYVRQVGQTGKAVAPKLYLALGISGAIQHMAGVGADTIVAVNTDPDAPIFQSANYGLKTDCGVFLAEMLALLPER